MSDIESLQRILAERSVRVGSFVLASGKTSSVYVDARLTTMSPDGMVLIGKLGLERIRSSGWNPDSIGGLTLGADPVAYAISHASAHDKNPLRAFTVRKQPKDHGTGKRIEGPFREGDRVVVIEDVITTGSSALQAISAIEQEGGVVTGVLAIVDRQDGGKDAIRSAGYEVKTLTTIGELTTYSSRSDSGGG